MKTKIIYLLIMLIGCTAAVYGGGRRQGDKVGVSVAESIYDFGTIYDDSPNVQHTFTLTNNGSGAVAILSASASCGCTKPKYDKKPFRPGESSQIHVTFIPTGQSGEINKDVKVRLKSAAGKSETVNLHLRGVVLPRQSKR